MEFVLRIFFSGLIAFVPSADEKELTVLLIKAPHEYAMADGSTLAHHKPLLLARAAHCEGACVTDDHGSIASFMFANKTPQQAAAALNSALLSGGAWELSGSELSFGCAKDPLAIRTGVRARTEDGRLKPVPATPAEREDFSWVTDLTELSPGTEGFRSSLTGQEPPAELVAARLKLRSGKIMTYSLVKIDGKARPVHFRKPSGEGPEAPYAQALATWVEAKISISGESVEIVDQSFTDPTRRRSMKLRPQDGVVEMALVNFPPFEAPDPDAPAPSPQPGQHFQVFYELVKTPPAQSDRLVPHQALSAAASEPQVDWVSLHPRQALWSNLLEQLGMSPRGSKTPYEILLCPMVKE
jgi:hypothetical protein